MKNKTIFYLILVLLAMSVIFGFSSEDAAASSDTSGNFALILARWFPGFLEKSVSSQKEFLEVFQIVLRECAHVFTYLCLGIAVELFHGSQWPHQGQGKMIQLLWKAILFCMITAIVDECYQEYMIVGRTFQVIDLVKDWGGSMIGTIFVYLFRNCCAKMQKKMEKIC